MPKPVALAAIALGSNLGDRALTLLAAVESLREFGEVVSVSGFLDTEPVGYTDQPRFLNAAAILRTDLQPTELLRSLLRTEQRHGRDRSHGIAKGPRTLDLDLLLYDDVVLESDGLTLPHPELHCRGFVLQPLVQIAPDWMHPVLQLSMMQLLRGLVVG